MDTIIVVPCYNERERLRSDLFSGFLGQNPGAGFVFVDDGSSDGTPLLLSRIRRRHGKRVEVLSLGANRGKGEAVRRGILAALARKPQFVGYWDADLSTPLEAVGELKAVFFDRPHIQWVIGARVKLLGRQIDRLPVRHYVGRVFATIASTILRLPVYDTQCGAKLFRATPDLAAILSDRFVSSWVFDVELIARFGRRQSETGGLPVSRCIYEYPLRVWRHRRGTKLRPLDWLQSASDLYRIWRTIS